jgi:hypothetical protein
MAASPASFLALSALGTSRRYRSGERAAVGPRQGLLDWYYAQGMLKDAATLVDEPIANVEK